MYTKEGKAQIVSEDVKVVSKQMDVFYNPIMSLNRDISILLLNSIGRRNLQIADLLAASGIRSIRFVKELDKGKIKKIFVNDINKDAFASIKKNLKLNKIELYGSKIEISNKDANLFLLESNGFDYIDIDPFGTPSSFLDAASKRIAREGILAVTATDTSSLCGTYPSACLRKYWALPKNDVLMHESGLRILIRKVQLIGCQYEKALFPIFSYSKDHYMRIFFMCEKNKAKTDEVLANHGMFNEAGPMWLGSLWNLGLCKKMFDVALKKFPKNKELIKFLETIKNESKIGTVGFYDVDEICSRNKIPKIPKKEMLIKKIRSKGFDIFPTHFSKSGFRSNISEKEFVKILRTKT